MLYRITGKEPLKCGPAVGWRHLGAEFWSHIRLFWPPRPHPTGRRQFWYFNAAAAQVHRSGLYLIKDKNTVCAELIIVCHVEFSCCQMRTRNFKV
jgi:hypothetical protein